MMKEMPRTSAERIDRSRCRGVTLLELLVTVAIVAILGVIAIPSYVQYVVRANRSVAKSFLLQVADREEQYFADHKSYAGLSALGYTADTIYVDNTGAVVPGSSADRIYLVKAAPGSTTFLIKATPQLSQASRDTKCLTLTLNETGVKGAGSAGCW